MTLPTRPTDWAPSPAQLPVSFAHALEHVAARAPERTALVVQGKHGDIDRLTFAGLAAARDRCAHALTALGIAPGHRVLMMIRPGSAFAVVSFALLKMRAVPVFVDPAIGLARLLTCIESAEPDALIGIPAAHLLRVVYRRRFRSVRLAIVSEGGFFGAPSLKAILGAQRDEPFEAPPPRPDELAGIVFTSGSTGPPKGVEWTYENLQAQQEVYRQLFAFGEDSVDLVTFPAFLLPALALGNTCVLPAMNFSRPGAADPEAIARAIRDHAPTHSFASPALWRRVTDHFIARAVSFDSLRRVATGGTAIPPALLERMQQIFPVAKVSTPYGATEALPISFVECGELRDTSAATTAGRGTCVGRPAPGVEVRILRFTDGAIPDFGGAVLLEAGRIGEILVSGGVVTRRYFGRPADTARTKIDEAGGRRWHRTGDAGYLDEQGRLWFCGRVQHRIVRGEETYYPAMLEGIFDAQPGVRRSSVVGVAGELVLVVEADPAARRTALRRELLTVAEAHRLPVRAVLFRNRLPVDRRHNAKLDVPAITTWAAGRLGARL